MPAKAGRRHVRLRGTARKPPASPPASSFKPGPTPFRLPSFARRAQHGRAQADCRRSIGPATIPLPSTEPLRYRSTTACMPTAASAGRTSSSRALTDPTRELRSYPSALIGSPRHNDAATFTITPSGAVTGVRVFGEDSTSWDPTSIVRSSALSDLFSQSSQTPLLVFLTILAAFGLGALHGLEPGHGKALLAFTLVGARATFKQAAILAAALTFAHTIAVLLLGLLLFFAAGFATESIFTWITLISGLAVAVIGARALSIAVRVRPHEREHAHAHQHGHGTNITTSTVTITVIRTRFPARRRCISQCRHRRNERRHRAVPRRDRRAVDRAASAPRRIRALPDRRLQPRPRRHPHRLRSGRRPRRRVASAAFRLRAPRARSLRS